MWLNILIQSTIMHVFYAYFDGTFTEGNVPDECYGVFT